MPIFRFSAANIKCEICNFTIAAHSSVIIHYFDSHYVKLSLKK
jgi:hypothetical protein